MTIEEYKQRAFKDIVGLENFTGNSLPSIAHHLAIKYFKYGKTGSMYDITQGILVLSEYGVSTDCLFGEDYKTFTTCDILDIRMFDKNDYIINNSHITSVFIAINDNLYETDRYIIHCRKLRDSRGGAE